ncbi:MAG: hypothetical protein MH204_00625 [Fimbriimonadaceae bacterium]|nr:hypothetical protein [Fimbriimonadaceae bacterium]
MLQPERPVSAFYIGHSLASDIPDMVKSMAGSGFDFREQFIPGAPLRWQWEEPTRNDKNVDHYRGLYTRMLTDQTTDLVMIDSVPRGEEASLQESIQAAGKFVDFARKKNPQVRVWYYEPWHHITSGTPQASEYDKSSPSRNLRWRPRITEDRKKWDRVVAEVNRRHPGAKPMKLIPGASALGLAADEIAAGRVPGLRSINDLFSDDIHLTPLGRFLVACVHYRALTGRPSAGRRWEVVDRWDRAYFGAADWTGKVWPKPAPETARALQSIADRVPLP